MEGGFRTAPGTWNELQQVNFLSKSNNLQLTRIYDFLNHLQGKHLLEISNQNWDPVLKPHVALALKQLTGFLAIIFGSKLTVELLKSFWLKEHLVYSKANFVAHRFLIQPQSERLHSYKLKISLRKCWILTVISTAG